MTVFIRVLAFLAITAVIAGCGSGAVRQNDKAAQLNAQLGINYFNKGDLQQADAKLRRALKQDPNLAVAHWSFALLQSR